MGRKSTYTTEIADEICERLAAGETLRQICQNRMIAHSTVLQWVNDLPSFADRYARARSEGLDVLAQEIIAIADNDRICEKVKLGPGGEVIEKTIVDMVERSKLQVDARKWLLSKLRPDKYGDRTAVDIGGQAGNQLRIVVEGADGKPLP